MAGGSAAPTYFDAYQLTPDLSLIDGGLYRNNPAGVVIKDMLKEYLKTFNKTGIRLYTYLL